MVILLTFLKFSFFSLFFIPVFEHLFYTIPLGLLSVMGISIYVDVEELFHFH